MSMGATRQRFVDRYRSMTARERLLVTLAVVVVLYVAWDGFWHAPLSRRNDQLAQSNTQLRQQIEALHQSRATLQARLREDPGTGLRARIERLRAEQRKLDEKLEDYRLALIPPRKMARLLRDLMAREPGLELLHLASLPSEVALRSGDHAENVEKGESPPEEGEPLVFRHPVEIRFRGSFPQALSYIRRLESKAWRFYWQELELTTDPERGYPHAEVRLRLFTLSVDEGWIGG